MRALDEVSFSLEKGKFVYFYDNYDSHGHRDIFGL